MEYNETLLAIAGLAVTLSGFASLATAVRARRDHQLRTLDTFRLRSMLEVALHTTAFALFPLPFVQTSPVDSLVWRTLSGISFVSVSIHFVYTRHKVRTKGLSELRLRARAVPMALSVVTILLSLGNAAGLSGPYAFQVYLSGLVLGLVVSALAFLTVAHSILEPLPEP